ncbi:MAG: TonB-dependent receptor [Gammaproteobacteria bacterium]|nr:TonB-dependent receptor [Gammaproteobacteria bacterium]
MVSNWRVLIVVAASGLSCGISAGAVYAAEGAGFDDEIVVVAPAPGAAARLKADTLPFTVQSTDADALSRAQSSDLTDYLGAHLGSVSINSAQGNPLQPDVQYRGYTASPLLGLAQGIAVFQNGVRVNEPLGDAVNWDLLPESAVHSMTMIGGSNPLYGLNTLGGALSIEMKNGFNYTGQEAEASGGSWGRAETSAESGGNNGTLGYYVNVDYFGEDGWRDLSDSNAVNVYGAASYRGAGTTLDLGFQYGNTDLTGNGSSPIGLVAVDREAIFTAPDITENEVYGFTLNGGHDVGEGIKLATTGFYRDVETSSFNGDASDFLACQLGSGQFLLEGIDEDALGAVGLDDEDICANNALGAANPAALQAALNGLVGPGGEPFNLDDLTSSLTGTRRISDAAINNISSRSQQSYGLDVQGSVQRDLFGRGNFLIVGAGYARGEARFNSATELSEIDPVTRSTAGLGLGSFLSREATNVDTSNGTWSIYLLDSFNLTSRLTVTAGGRYNDTRVKISDRSAARPELNGSHGYSRFNPSAGATFEIADRNSVYANYSESSRAPTPIELSCNDQIFDRARAAAIARGEDPEDVNFECRLPNAFLADPELKQVVAKSVEFGVRGELGVVRHRLGYFRTVNHDDIIFQTTGRGTGLFANVDKTKREGFESAFAVTLGALDYAIAYSYVLATFEDNFKVQSPNHPLADANGELAVRSGDRIPGIPAHQFKFSTDYRTPWQLTLGLDLQYFSGQYLRGDESNQLAQLDGYALVNLRASYAVNKHLDVFTRVSNVFDTDYESFGLLGESPEEVLPGLADQRPLFIGAGAPRAAWVGVRLRL